MSRLGEIDRPAWFTRRAESVARNRLNVAHVDDCEELDIDAHRTDADCVTEFTDMMRPTLDKIAIALIAAAMLATAACKSGDDANATAESADEQTEAAADEAASDDEGDQKADNEAADEGEKVDDKPEGAKEQAELPDDLPAGETGTYGGEFTIEEEPVTLASALETGESGTYKIKARVEKVCKKKGCWFTLNDEGVEQPVRVKMKDYGFFVPRNSDGATAIVEGELERRVVPEAEAQHYADDEVAGTDKKPRKVEGDQEKWEMMITAAQIEMPASEDGAQN
jgi:hypothetical protein